MSEDITVEKVQALITRAPFHQWLGLQVTALHDDGIELKAKWREEWVVNPDRRYTHGGILAALVDRVRWILERELAEDDREVPRVVLGRGDVVDCRPQQSLLRIDQALERAALYIDQMWDFERVL